jgi:phage shock protein E
MPWSRRASLALAVCLASSGCSESDSARPKRTAEAATATAKKQDPAAARTLIANGAVVIDVRSAQEVTEGALPTATNIPVDEVASRLDDIETLVGGDKAKPIVVYCRTGRRSRLAQQQLEAAGFTHVVNGGGIDDVR